MNKVRAKGRAINGILLLDKPEGISSNTALQTIKRRYQAQKAGHTGSLDPLATGMLPICFGEATKFTQFLLDADKTYLVTMKLGIETTTGDKEGEIVSQKPVPNIDATIITNLFEQFKGPIAQIPSMYSALKHKGQSLYKLARKGIEVERPARQVHIYALDYLEHTLDEITFQVTCSKGTYIRTLAEDMGKILDCGAHVSSLRRLSIAHFQASQMKTLPELEKIHELEDFIGLDQQLLSIQEAITSCPEIQLSEAAIYYLKQGQAIISPAAPTSGLVKLIRKNGGFLGIGEILSDGRVAPRRLINTQ